MIQCIETKRIYKSINEAANDLYMCRQSISKAVRGIQKTAAGYHWRVLPLLRCVETGTEYNTFTEAERDTQTDRKCIACCCKGLRKTAGGLHWKYCDNE